MTGTETNNFQPAPHFRFGFNPFAQSQNEQKDVCIARVDSLIRKRQFSYAPKSFLWSPYDQTESHSELNKLFSKANPLVKNGAKFERWIAFDGQGKCIGRIAAFTFPDSSNQGGIGFFDFVPHFEICQRLFSIACGWLKEQSVSQVDIPINFGKTDRWTGLFIDGSNETVEGMRSHPPYYHHYFKQLRLDVKSDQSVELNDQFLKSPCYRVFETYL